MFAITTRETAPHVDGDAISRTVPAGSVGLIFGDGWRHSNGTRYVAVDFGSVTGDFATSDLRCVPQSEYVNLLDLLDKGAADDDRYGSSSRYHQWEQEIATPALQRLGFHVHRWYTGERDSWGPLSRVCVVTLNGETQKLVYG